MQSRHFEYYGWKTGFIAGFGGNEPSELWGIQGERLGFGAELPRGATVFGYLFGGVARITVDGKSFVLNRENYFVANSDDLILDGFPGTALLLMVRQDSSAPFLLGGPLEAQGRLKYIDGCTDSLLLPPWRKGEPCLNHLHFPPRIEQTSHTHPSDRIGVVVRGYGKCDTPDGEVDLIPGMIWRIPADGQHRFRTFCRGMDVVAFHPISEVGPTDEVHQMVVATIVDGVSASRIPEIRTA